MSGRAQLRVDRLEPRLRVAEGADDRRVELPAGLAEDLVLSGSPRECHPVRTVARHGVERIRDREDPGAPWNLLPCQAVRIAVAVPALVVRANDLEPRALEECDAPEHLLAEDRVRLHLSPFLPGERTRLLKDA